MAVKTIRVGFHARGLSAANLRGFGRYTLNLLLRLPDYGVRPILCSKEPIHESHRSRLPAGQFDTAVGGSSHPLLWDQTWPKLARQYGADLLHAPGNHGYPLFPRLPGVVTIHDAIDYIYYRDRFAVPDHFRKPDLIARWMHWSARLSPRRVITVSDYSQRDITRRLRVPKKKIDVIYEAADPSFKPASANAIEAVRNQFGLAEPYFLYFGGWEKRKNVKFLIDAFAEANLPTVKLVLAGGGSGEERALQDHARQRKIDDRIVWLGHVADAEIIALLSGALAYVYPSFYEGFGLQLCEAMACHCPILAARATCLPEILGRGGETFTLRAANELAGLLRRTASDVDFREGLVQRSAARGRDFSWDRCAEQTAAVYRSLLARKAT